MIDIDGYEALALSVAILGALPTIAVAVLAVAAVLIVAAGVSYGVYQMSKGGKQNIRDTGYAKMPPDYIEQRYREYEGKKRLTAEERAEKLKLKEQLKAHGRSNVRKRQNSKKARTKVRTKARHQTVNH